MTAQLGTFIPLQAQPTGWGSQSLNHSANFGLTGWNPNAILSHNPAQNPQHTTSLLVAPGVSYPLGNSLGEITQAVTHTGSTVAFIPHSSPIGGSFVPSNTTVQGIPSGTTFVNVPSWQSGNQAVSTVSLGNPSLSQSFAAELSETNHEFVLSFDVPGIDVEDLDVSLSGNTIFINGVRRDSSEATTLAYSEVAKGNITRTISVPFDVSPNKAINTSLDNGVLKIRIAKESQSEKRATSRKIKIG